MQKKIELGLANNQFKALSEVDPLTGIHNRRYYEKQLIADIAVAKRTVKPISMLLIDIDNFKEYNDKYGHSQGNHALISVAAAIRSSIPRESDWVASLGGEEFVVTLLSTDVAGANLVAESIRLNVAQLKIPLPHPTGAHTTVTVSIGISSLTGSNLDRADLFQQADMALYSAKAGGRNQCRTYDEKWAERGS